MTQPKRKTKYVSMNVTIPARDALQGFQVTAIGALGRRVSLSDALRLAVAVAAKHPDELRASAVEFGLIDPPAESIGETSDHDHR